MKITQTIINVRLITFFILGFGLAIPLGTANTPTASAAELTTWQKFIQKKCSGSTADAAARCAEGLTTSLKDKCGAPKETDKYINCWRTFIKNNGGTAGPKSSPFEEENPVGGGGGGGTTTDEARGCGNIDTAILRCNDNGGNPIVSLLLQIVNFLALGVGVAVVGGIIWGGMMYASSNGDASKTKQAITIIVNAVVGLLLFMFTYALINFLVPGGLFT